jgi:hypothetical protein
MMELGKAAFTAFRSRIKKSGSICNCLLEAEFKNPARFLTAIWGLLTAILLVKSFSKTLKGLGGVGICK